MHHHAGRAFEFRVPLCRSCHVEATVALRRLKIDTSGKGRNITLEAYKAATFFLWFMLERLDLEVRINQDTKATSKKKELKKGVS
jgi:hypothetical protein